MTVLVQIVYKNPGAAACSKTVCRMSCHSFPNLLQTVKMKFSLLFSSFVWGAQATIYYAGVSESSGEFGAYGTKGTGLPGTFGTTYAFINKAAVDIYVDQENVRRKFDMHQRYCLG